MTNAPQKEVKSIITDALYGSVDMQSSIEKLSELLFPGENLIEQIRNQKIVNDITTKVAFFQEKAKIELLGIKREADVFHISLEFAEVKDFLSEQQKILAHLTQVAKGYNATFQTTFMITQTIS